MKTLSCLVLAIVLIIQSTVNGSPILPSSDTPKTTTIQSESSQLTTDVFTEEVFKKEPTLTIASSQPTAVSSPAPKSAKTTIKTPIPGSTTPGSDDKPTSPTSTISAPPDTTITTAPSQNDTTTPGHNDTSITPTVNTTITPTANTTITPTANTTITPTVNTTITPTVNTTITPTVNTTITPTVNTTFTPTVNTTFTPTTSPVTQKPSSASGSSFDVASFFGGVALVAGLVIICYVGISCYRKKAGDGYKAM